MATISPLAVRKTRSRGVSTAPTDAFNRAGEHWRYLFPERVYWFSPNCEQGKHGFCDGSTGETSPVVQLGAVRGQVSVLTVCQCRCGHSGVRPTPVAVVRPSAVELRTRVEGRTRAERLEEDRWKGRVVASNGSCAVQGYAGRGATLGRHEGRKIAVKPRGRRTVRAGAEDVPVNRRKL